MAEGVVSRAFIMSNMSSTPAATIRVNPKTVLTVQNFASITETEFISEIEQPVVQPSGAAFFEYSLNESAIAIAEGLVRQKKAVRALSETAIVVTESKTKRVTHPLTESTIVVTDGLAKQKKAIRNVSEPATAIAEQLARSIKRVKAISETAIAITSGVAASRIYPRTIAPETTVISEVSLVKVSKKIRALLEPHTTIDEELAHLRTSGISESPLTVSDSLAKALVFTRGISEGAISVSDSLRNKPTHALTQTTPITEGINKIRGFPRSLSESVFLGIPYAGTVSYTYDSFSFSLTHLTTEQLHILIHRPLSEITTISDLLVHITTLVRAISEDTAITEALAPYRFFRRYINPESYTSASFTTATFESFNTPSGDVVEILEELEAFVLPPNEKVLIEPYAVITESLQAVKIPVPVIMSGGVGRRRRRLPRWFYRRAPILRPPTREKEPEQEPMLTEITINEIPTQITESLSAVKITAPLPIPKVASIAIAPPQIIQNVEPEPEHTPLLITPILQPLEPEKDDPFFKQPEQIHLEKEPEERLEPMTISIAEPPKSKAAATLRTLQNLLLTSELEAMVS